MEWLRTLYIFFSRLIQFTPDSSNKKHTSKKTFKTIKVEMTTDYKISEWCVGARGFLKKIGQTKRVCRMYKFM